MCAQAIANFSGTVTDQLTSVAFVMTTFIANELKGDPHWAVALVLSFQGYWVIYD